MANKKIKPFTEDFIKETTKQLKANKDTIDNLPVGNPKWNKKITNFNEFKELTTFVEANKESNLYIKLGDGEIISGVYVNADTDDDFTQAWIEFNGISTNNHNNQGIGNFRISWDDTNKQLKYSNFELGLDNDINFDKLISMGNIEVIRYVNSDGSEEFDNFKDTRQIYSKFYIDSLKQEINYLKNSMPPVEYMANGNYYNSIAHFFGASHYSSTFFKNISLPNAFRISAEAFPRSSPYDLYIPRAVKIDDNAFVNIYNEYSTTVTMPTQFNTKAEKDRIFGVDHWDEIVFRWTSTTGIKILLTLKDLLLGKLYPSYAEIQSIKDQGMPKYIKLLMAPYATLPVQLDTKKIYKQGEVVGELEWDTMSSNIIMPINCKIVNVISQSEIDQVLTNDDIDVLLNTRFMQIEII